MKPFVAPALSSSAEPAPMLAAQAKAKPFALAAILWLLYLGVGALMLARLLYGLVAVVRLWTTAEPVCLDPESDLARGIRLRCSRRIASPVALSSGVVLPAEYRQWDRQKLRIVLAHEGSHVRQRDFFLQVFAALHAALFWFSPLSWWLKRKLSDLGEAVSDRAGLEAAGSRSSYAQILLEFAALPRPTLLGVAMAHNSNLSLRIERFLNESHFHRAFTGSRRRALLAIVLVPILIVAFTALIRVEAAATPREAAHLQTAGQETPPAPPAAPNAPQMPPETPAPPSPDIALPMPPEAPIPPPPDAAGLANSVRAMKMAQDRSGHPSQRQGNGFADSNLPNGESYALITGDGGPQHFSGSWYDSRRAEIEKARKMAHGNFLWFTRDGKSYIFDDQSVVAQLEAMFKPIEALAKQQDELGKQQEALGKQQEALGRKMEEVKVPTPDMSKQIDELEKQMEKLRQMQGKSMSSEEWADMESKLGNLEGKLGAIQGEIGARQGSLGGEMGRLGGLQGELGAKQGKLGAEQGLLSEKIGRKVKEMIDQALRDGKARPVE